MCESASARAAQVSIPGSLLKGSGGHPIRVATAFAAVFIKGLQLEKINFAQDKTRASAEDFFREAVTEGSSPVRQSDGSSRSCKFVVAEP